MWCAAWCFSCARSAPEQVRAALGPGHPRNTPILGHSSFTDSPESSASARRIFADIAGSNHRSACGRAWGLGLRLCPDRRASARRPTPWDPHFRTGGLSSVTPGPCPIGSAKRGPFRSGTEAVCTTYLHCGQSPQVRCGRRRIPGSGNSEVVHGRRGSPLYRRLSVPCGAGWWLGLSHRSQGGTESSRRFFKHCGRRPPVPDDDAWLRGQRSVHSQRPQ